MSRLSSLWRNLVHRDRVNRDLDDEMRALFDTLVDEKMQAGMSAEHARRAAKLELGGVEPVKQQVRDERSGAYVDAFFKDVRYGLRMLRRNVGFTLVVVLSLAAGIGANSAIFSVANALLLRTLPVPDAGHLYVVRFQSRLPVTPRYSYPLFERLRAGFTDQQTIAAMSRVGRMRTYVDDGNQPEPTAMQLVSGEFFATLALHPRLGRLLTVDDNRTLGGHPVVVVSSAFWRRRLGGTDDVLGKSLTFNGARFTIVGVGPDGFSGVWLESPVDAWIPIAMQGNVGYQQNFSASNSEIDKPWMPQDSIRWLEIILRAGRPDGQETAALNAVFQPEVLRAADEIKNEEQRKLALDRRLILEPFAHGNSNLRTRFQAPLFALMGMVALLLLIACANTANLLLARATSRRHEMALRLSLGASRLRVVCQLLTESVMLGAMAAAVGLLIAPFASELLVRMTIGQASGPLPFSVGVDARVLGFTALLTLLTSLLFGLAPAWRATDMTLSGELKSGGRGMKGGGRTNLGRLLVVSQVALSLLLVVGAGLFLRSFRNLSELPLGFQPEHVLSASMNAKVGGYAPAELPALYQRLVERADYRGLRYALGRAQVVNLSLGGEEDRGEVEVLKDLIDGGVVVVAAMGNEFEEGNPVEYPAAMDEVFAVGATDQLDRRASFSNTGAHIDIVAPGVEILSTTPTYAYDDGRSDYDSWDGTSMATPHVSAAVALLLARSPRLTPAQAIKRVKSRADRVKGMTSRSGPSFGAGRLNIEAALR